MMTKYNSHKLLGNAIGSNVTDAILPLEDVPLLKEKVIGRTNIGVGRIKNQDAASAYVYYKDHKPIVILSVADGLGCFEYSEHASYQAVTKLPLSYVQSENIDQSFLKLHNKFIEGHPYLLKSGNLDTLKKIAKKEPLRKKGDCGASTLVFAKIEGHEVEIANVGDSRAYLIRDRQVIYQTRDQSYMELLLAEGKVDCDLQLIKKHPLGHIILNALGVEEETYQFIDDGKIILRPTGLPYKDKLDLNKGDYLLMATDGFFGNINENIMLQMIETVSWQKLNHELTKYLLDVFNKGKKSSYKTAHPDNFTFLIYRHI